MADKSYHVILWGLFRKYVLAIGFIVAIILWAYYEVDSHTHYVYKDRMTTIEEIARFKNNGDSMILYRIDYNKAITFSLTKK